LELAVDAAHVTRGKCVYYYSSTPSTFFIV